MRRPPRILTSVGSLAGQLALRGFRAQLVTTTDSDYNGLELVMRLHDHRYRVLWHLAHQDSRYWAFHLLDGEGQIIFRSCIDIPTREGSTHLVPTRDGMPLFHITTAAETVADYAAHCDYSLYLPLSAPTVD